MTSSLRNLTSPGGSSPLPTFGALLREYRVAAGLTQEALAEGAGLSVRAISDLERGVKRHPHFESLRRLVDALSLSDEARAHFTAAARDVLPPPLPPVLRSLLPPLPLPLPLPVPLTPLVERERETANAVALLRRADVRWLTVTGPGGVGKTRLALAVAQKVADDYADGVCFVSLAAVTEPSAVLPAIAGALNLSDAAGQSLDTRLVAHLRARRLLLVLDNFEQVAAAGTDVVAVLAHCPHTGVLATSRETVAVRGERLFPLAPLTVPAATGPTDAATVAAAGAVQLFVQQATARVPTFVLTDANAAAVAAICARLDGLPLAIELAAARITVFSPPALLARLAQPLDLLTGGARDLPARHRTLRDALAWSYDLLTAAEQRLFRALSVCAGGWTLAVAEALDGAETGAVSVADTLGSLVSKSLVWRTEAANEVRFGMLETVREYGRELLAARGETDAVRARHAAYFAALAAEAEPHLQGAEQVAWLTLLAREHDNVRAALTWTRERGNAATGLLLAADLARFWEIRGHFTEGRRWLDAFLALPADGRDSRVRVRALKAAGSLAYRQSDFARATAGWEESLRVLRGLGETRQIPAVLNNLGIVATDQGDYDRACALHEEALALKRALDEPERSIATSLHNLGLALVGRGDALRATALYAEAATLWERAGHQWGLAMALNNWGEAVVAQGDDVQATALFTRSLTLRRELGDTWGIALSLKNLAALALRRGDEAAAVAAYRDSLAYSLSAEYHAGIAPVLEGLARIALARDEATDAAHLAGAAAALRASLHTAALPTEQAAAGDTVTAVREVLGASFAPAWDAGQRTPIADVIASIDRWVA